MGTHYDDYEGKTMYDKVPSGALSPTGMEHGGGGYICSLSRLKALAIKTPLQYHNVWNKLVNECTTEKQLNDLVISDKSEK